MNLRNFYILTAFLLAQPAFSQSQELQAEAEAAATFEAVEGEIQKPDGLLKKLSAKVQQTTQSPAFNSKIQKEFAKFRIRFTVDLIGNLSIGESLNTNAYYQFVVEPAFRNNEQMRRDIWVVDLGAGSGKLAVGTQVRISFIRYFSGPDAKKQALFAPVKWPWEAPMNTNDIKTKMKNGEGYRSEVNGNFSVGASDSLVKSGFRGDSSTSLAYRRAGNLIVDLYKINETTVRSRFIGLKNRGEIQFGASLQTEDPFRSAPGKLKELLTFGLHGSFRHSILSFLNPMSQDTLMVDYLFTFANANKLTKAQLQNDTSTGEAALEEILSNMRKGKLASIFLLFTEDGDLMRELSEKMKLAEDLAKKDMAKFKEGKSKFSDVRVYNYFKGRMISSLRVGELGAKLSGLVKGSSQSGSILSHVAAYDENGAVSYYWLDNSFTYHRGRSLFETNIYNYSHDLDVLVESDAQKGFGSLKDVVVRTQIEDTTVTARDMEQYRKIIKDSLPKAFVAEQDFDSLLPKTQQTNAFIGIRQSYGEAAFKVIGKMDRPRLTMALIDFFENHPHRRFMNLPPDQQDANIGMGTFAEKKAHEIANIFDPSATNKETMQAFAIAKRDPLFERYLVGEFFGRLLPQDNPHPYMSYDLKISSAEMGTKSSQGGDNKVSSIYGAVAFMRSIISSQSIDMQMVSSDDSSGNALPLPAADKDFLGSRMREQSQKH